MLELIAKKRDKKINAEMLRQTGKIPAVFYGRKEASTPVSLDILLFKKALREAGESTVLTLKTDDKEISVLIHDVAYEPLHGEPIHVDFYAVEADKAVEVKVPIIFTNSAPAEKNLGGVLVKVLHEVSISALPKDLPHELSVDLSVLRAMDDSITAGDVSLPAGVTLVENPDEVVAAMSEAKEEEESTEEFDPDAVEVETKGKEEEEEIPSEDSVKKE
ncbi:MAG: 50S ribosomal protein L25 [Candidatus Paceibacterota bacterium]